MPRLEGRSGTLRVSYGHGPGGADDLPPASTEQVWSSGYVAVFHLAEAVATPRDATGRHTGPGGVVALGAPAVPPPPQGKIGPGRAFASLRQTAIAVDALDVEYPSLTISGWMYEILPVPAGGYHAMVARQYVAGGENVFWLGNSNGIYRGELERSDGTYFLDGGDALTGGWVHLALTANVNNAVLYVDGVATMTTAIGGLPTPDGLRSITLGADVNDGDFVPNDDLLDGLLDEVRIEREVRSPEWLRVQYLAMTDQLVSYGEIQRGPPP